MMRTREDGQAMRVTNPIGTMNSILPVNVREYFLFDGEKIDNFAKPEAAKQVKDAIYLVLKTRSFRSCTEASRSDGTGLSQGIKGDFRRRTTRVG